MGRPRKPPAVVGRGLALMEQGLSPQDAAAQLEQEGTKISWRALYDAKGRRLAPVESAPDLGYDDPWGALRAIVQALAPALLPELEEGLRRNAQEGARALQDWLATRTAEPPELTSDQRAEILDSVETLLAPVRAAQAQGISEAEWRALLLADPDLQRELARREAIGEQRLVRLIAEGEEVSTYLRVLANRWPERYAR